MKTKSSYYLSAAIVLITIQSIAQISCNPIGYDPSMTPFFAMPHIPFTPPFMIAPQFDPYAAMHSHSPYLYSSPFAPMQAESRRSAPLFAAKPIERTTRTKVNEPDNDEQKALEGLPVSFVSSLNGQ